MELCDILRTLANDKTDKVRVKVASNQYIPDKCACEILTTLASDSNDAVRANVMNNRALEDLPNECGCKLLLKFTSDPNDNLRAAMADNKYLPPECRCEILKKLALDRATLVRHFIHKKLALDKSYNYVPQECRPEVTKSLEQMELVSPTGYTPGEHWSRAPPSPVVALGLQAAYVEDE